MSVSLKQLIRRKQRLYKCTKHYNSDTKWKECKDTSKKVRIQIRQQHTNYLSNTVFSNDTNSKTLFWRYIKARKKTNESINCPKSNTSSLILTLNRNLKYLMLNFNPFLLLRTSLTCQIKEYLPIQKSMTNSGVCKLLSDCHPHKSAGPDNIHSSFLKNTTNELSPMLTHLFQASLSGNKPILHLYTKLVQEVKLKIIVPFH